jgi:hypothetical protein
LKHCIYLFGKYFVSISPDRHQCKYQQSNVPFKGFAKKYIRCLYKTEQQIIDLKTPLNGLNKYCAGIIYVMFLLDINWQCYITFTSYTVKLVVKPVVNILKRGKKDFLLLTVQMFTFILNCCINVLIESFLFFSLTRGIVCLRRSKPGDFDCNIYPTPRGICQLCLAAFTISLVSPGVDPTGKPMICALGFRLVSNVGLLVCRTH